MGQYRPLDRRRKKAPIVPALPTEPLPTYVVTERRRQLASIDAQLAAAAADSERVRVSRGIVTGFVDTVAAMGRAFLWVFSRVLDSALLIAIVLGLVGCIVFGIRYLLG